MRFPTEMIAALNGFGGVKKVQLRGRNSAISNSAETLWGPAAGTYAKLTAATALEVLSGDANDAAAGTGARTVVVEGLLSTYETFTETVTLNGASPVALTNTTAIAINRVYVATVGSGGVNAGAITVRTVSGSTAKAQILAGAGQASDFIYTIPTGCVGLMRDIHFSGTGVTGDVTVSLFSSNSSGVLKKEGEGKSSLYVTAFNACIGRIHFGDGLLIDSQTLLELRAVNSAGAGDLVAQGDLYVINRALSGW